MNTYHCCIIQQSLSTLQHGMFYAARSFNQNIGNWDVSKSTMFVSITLTCKELNLIWLNTWILIIVVSSNNNCLHFSLRCFPQRTPSTNILATGMSLRVQTLWVLFWPVKNWIWFDIIHEYWSLLYHPTITVYTSA